MLNQQKYTYQPANLKKVSYAFSLEVVRFVKNLPENKVLTPIGDQIIRSSTSVGANIIEASVSSSNKESKKYFEIALKSSRKSEYWLLLLRDSHDEYRRDIDELIPKVQNIRAILELSLESAEGSVN